MSALSSGFLGAEAAAGASMALDQAIEDLRVKYEKKAADEAAKGECAACVEGTCDAAPGAGAGAGEDGDSDEDWLDDPELDKLRESRLKELKEMSEKKKMHTVLGLGEYREITEEDFLKEVTGTELVICHFYHKDFERCKIMDMHLRLLAPRHYSTKFIHINAEKAPFFVTKLAIRVLPTVVCFIDGVVKHRVTGFESLSGDEFRTEELEHQLERAGMFETKKKKKKSPDDSDYESDDDDDEEERREGATVAEILEGRKAKVHIGTRHAVAGDE